MAKPFNPFEHHHPEHDDGPEVPYEQLDPAQQSLADALRVTFFILKVVMVFLVVAFLISGIFTVKSDEVAIKLRFGTIVGEGTARVIQPGINFAWPYPVDQVVRVKTNVRTFDINTDFWWHVQDPTKSEDEQVGGDLDPNRDGSFITGDANIVHAKWQVEYRVSDPVMFIENVADLSISDAGRMLDAVVRQGKPGVSAETYVRPGVIRAIVEEALVHVMSRSQSDRLIKKQAADIAGAAVDHLRVELSEMETGIEIIGITVTDTRMPLSVRAAFQETVRAENDRAKFVADARKKAAEILGNVAGDAHESLWNLITEYDNAIEAGDMKLAQDVDDRLGFALREKELKKADGSPIPIQGDVAGIISGAVSFRSQVENQAKQRAQTFNQLKADYDANPRIFTAREWQKVVQAVFNDPDVEVFAVNGNLRIHMNRDPDKERERQTEAQKEIFRKSGREDLIKHDSE